MNLRGRVLPTLDADVRQAYPAAFSLACAHRVLFAEHLREVDRLDEVRALAATAAAGDWEPFLDPRTYERHALDRLMVLPAGERWPVELQSRNGPRLCVRLLTSAAPMPSTFGAAMLASFLAQRCVEVASAVGLVEVGSEVVRPIPLRDGVVVPAGDNPVAALVRLRPEEGVDDRLRACIRGITNPAAWGIFARLDQYRAGGGLSEKYAAWSWPVPGSCLPAIVGMWLAMIDRAVTDAGGAVVCRDTDGLAIVSSPASGMVELSERRVIRALSWGEVDALLRRFDALDPFGDGGAFWSTERDDADGRPLHLLSLGPKRYVKCLPDGARGFAVIGGTQHGLSGSVADAPGWQRDAWVRCAHEYAVARATGPELGWRAPWDEGAEQPFPVLRRFSAASPDALAD
ncbi:MAG: hypothetical protein ACRD6W_02995, partial [Nitrososphaerales archaeon]